MRTAAVTAPRAVGVGCKPIVSVVVAVLEAVDANQGVVVALTVSASINRIPGSDGLAAHKLMRRRAECVLEAVSMGHDLTKPFKQKVQRIASVPAASPEQEIKYIP